MKNLFELKNARRVLIEGNVFENNWAHAQNGTAILFTVRNQDGKAPWSAVQDVTMINNLLRNSPTAFVVMGYDSPEPEPAEPAVPDPQQPLRADRADRLHDHLGGRRRGDRPQYVRARPTTWRFVMTGLAGHDASGKVVGKPCQRFKLTNNIMGFGLYGPAVDGGQNTFAEAFPELTWDKNLFVGYGEGRAQSAMAEKQPIRPARSSSPSRRATVAYARRRLAGRGLRRLRQGDYRLAPASKYRRLGTDGKDLGVDMDSLNAATGPQVTVGESSSATPASQKDSL